MCRCRETGKFIQCPNGDDVDWKTAEIPEYAGCKIEEWWFYICRMVNLVNGYQSLDYCAFLRLYSHCGVLHSLLFMSTHKIRKNAASCFVRSWGEWTKTSNISARWILKSFYRDGKKRLHQLHDFTKGLPLDIALGCWYRWIHHWSRLRGPLVGS